MALHTARIEARNKTPDAPFKKNWHELMMKRLVDYAAKNGYDRIAITPGAEQASRYDLSKHINKIEFTKDPSGEYSLVADDKNGREVINRLASAKELPDLVGKELAQKIVEQGEGSLTGLDLKIGGEGMKGFYDKILPTYLNELGKPYGVKVGQMDLSYEPTAKQAQQGAADEALLSELGVEIPKARRPMLHTFDITPQMREAIKSKGLPLYKKGGAVRISDRPDTMNLELMMAEGGSPRQKLAKAIASGVKSLAKPAEKKSVLESLPKEEAKGRESAPALGLAAAPPAIVKGAKAAKTAKTVYPQTEALERARKNAVEMLGLPENNTPEMRAQAMGYIDYLHGTQRLDRLLEGKTLDPRRATSGPMPYGTTTPELASSYATSKADTSRRATDEGDVRRYFEVAPKDIGIQGLRSPLPVETAWHFMTPEQKARIRELAPRVGYENLDEFTGKLTVHPEGVNATLSPNQWEWLMKNEAKGNPLTALRHMWYESGQLVDEPEMLGQIYRLAGVNAPISQTKAPWTEAQGVLLGKARITNPIDTSNTEQVSALIEPLKQAFAKDRSKTKAGGPDQWAKESRYTPKTWVAELEKDLAEGKESYVWTSIPDKVTAELRKLGFNGIIDRSGKGGGAKEPVVIPFDPAQVRSRFAAFDPAEMDKPDLLKKRGGKVSITDNLDTMRLAVQKRK